MKIILLVLSLFSFTIKSSAQNLKLKQLLNFQKTGQKEINDQLIKKGWTFMVDNTPADKMMGRTIWAYNPVEPGNPEAGALAWLVLYSLPDSPNRILYNHFGQRVMQKLTKGMKRRKMGVLGEGTQLRGVNLLSSYTDFADDTFVFRIMTYQSPNGYGLKIFDKQDYLKAKENDRL